MATNLGKADYRVVVSVAGIAEGISVHIGLAGIHYNTAVVVTVLDAVVIIVSVAHIPHIVAVRIKRVGVEAANCVTPTNLFDLI